MATLDLKRELKELYNPSAKVISVVKVPTLNYLQVDGTGDPNTAQAYQDAVEALYSVAYTLKFTIKKAQGVDYAVMPLEGLWWVEDMTKFTVTDKGVWLWTMMILQPKYVTGALVRQAVEQAGKKKDLPSLSKLRFEKYAEGTAAQIMYIGSYADEGPTIAKLHEYIISSGHELYGKHHEIYLCDPRKTAPEKLKSVIRQPMR